MSWWGSSKKNDSGSGEQSMKIDDSAEFSSEGFQSSDIGTSYAGAPSGTVGARSPNNFQQEIMAEQQKAMVQAVMLKLTETAFDTCVTKPSSTLSYSEQSCIAAVTGKYLDASELIVGRFAASQQQ